MKKLFLLFPFIGLLTAAYGQAKTDSPKVYLRTFTNYADLRKQQGGNKISKLHYLDSTYNFDVEIPAWLNLRETGTRMVFGGTLPAVNGVENAISIKIFDKKNFTGLDAFKDYVIGDWPFGKHPKWSNEMICYDGRKDLGTLENIGEAYRASHFWRNHIYTCTYVLVETKTAFLWIDYTSTPDLYSVNEPKFEEFLRGFKITDF